MSKPLNSRLKRLPENSHTIILKFENRSQRDNCFFSQEFKKCLGELAVLLAKYNSTFETISWDVLKGTKLDRELDEEELIHIE